MEENSGLPLFKPQASKFYPAYINQQTYEYNHLKLLGHLKCLDCEGEFSLDQADSYMCRKVHQTVSRLANKGWDDKDILKECKRIYGNEVLLKHYGFDPPLFVIIIQSYKFLLIFYAAYFFRSKFFRVRWEKLVKYKRDKYY